MGLGQKLRSLVGGDRPPRIKVHVLVRGRIGEGWFDIDTTLKVAEGTTLSELIAFAETKNVPLQYAIDNSPHLRDTLMLNGDRCPVADNADRVMADGDELYLLAPIAGG